MSSYIHAKCGAVVEYMLDAVGGYGGLASVPRWFCPKCQRVIPRTEMKAREKQCADETTRRD